MLHECVLFLLVNAQDVLVVYFGLQEHVLALCRAQLLAEQGVFVLECSDARLELFHVQLPARARHGRRQPVAELPGQACPRGPL